MTNSITMGKAAQQAHIVAQDGKGHDSGLEDAIRDESWAIARKRMGATGDGALQKSEHLGKYTEKRRGVSSMSQ
jgi:hypothetical protein